MSRTIARVAAALFAACWLATAGAQSSVTNPPAANPPAVNPTEADLAKQQQARQQTQPGNNAPVWKEVRSGTPQYTSLPGRETNVLIQPEGQTWRAARVPLATVGGFLFVFSLVLFGVVYLWLGPIRLHGRPTGRLIERFTVVQRVVHWTVAITFTTLAVTGLILTFGKNVLLPLIGYTLFSILAQLSKTLHNFVGPVLVVALPILIAMFAGSNLFNQRDVVWVKNIRAYLTGGHAPADKANAGQKFLFWTMAVILGLTLCVTGLILDFPNFDQTRQTMQVTNIVHMIAGVLAVCLLVGHIYLGTIGMQGAWEAMRYGYVDETWAKEHHEYWYNDVMSGKAPRGAPPPSTLPPGHPARVA